ncbi:aminoglycoside phosphotransferase family protein [Aspergillus mulundensis]|uniref:Phosphotransferase family protein n=1 Tax=Aspergillus mulundensis TaxID=1810919 RepID=A0A3D8R8S4_9EURO|nr:Phosphotransferase family protein [Aspergillus mulundensis]RDW70457.1 Phosphotransferase family protein [Aspergillus mulundensis]
MTGGKTLIARIPNPNAGPPCLTTASEAATMDFLRNILPIPVPGVFAWSSATDSTNSVGAEYIIMEHAPGTNLAEVWENMELEQKVRTMEDIVTIQQRLLSLRFSEKDATPRSSPAVVHGERISGEDRTKIAERFSIGPNVDTDFWCNERAGMDIDRGPWASAIDYVQAVARREIAWIQKHVIPRSPDDPFFVSHSQNDPAEHVSLLERYLTVAPCLLPQENDLIGSYLWHSDLRTPNIFVDDTGHITSIIDWQSTYAAPLFLEGRHPSFLDYNGELLLQLPESFKTLDNETQATTKDKVTKSILLYLYEKYTAERNPLLHRVFRYPNGKLLTDPIRFAGCTWEGDILPLRESLIRVQKKWDSLGITAQCPIHFSPEEIRKHREQGEGWNEVQDFWDAVSGVVARDGWTSHETYHQGREIYAQIMASEEGESSSC